METEEAILFRLTTDVIQIIFKDESKVLIYSDLQILGPMMDQIVTYVEPNGTKTVYKMEDTLNFTGFNIK